MVRPKETCQDYNTASIDGKCADPLVEETAIHLGLGIIGCSIIRTTSNIDKVVGRFHMHEIYETSVRICRKGSMVNS